jgi:hypothetical protein
MKDAENLAKLVGHLKPEVFRSFLVDKLQVELPELEPKATRTEHREAMAAALGALPVATRQRIEETAERLILLTDGPGQDVVHGLRSEIVDDAARQTFDTLPDQYERALWLHVHAPSVFEEALYARQADVFRQSVTCYSGFVAPAGLTLATDGEVTAAFDATDLPGLRARLTELELADGDEACILRRTVGADGRSRAFVNGRPVALQSLREVGELLVDIHGQHAHQSLGRRDLQRQVLDEHAGHESLLEVVREQVRAIDVGQR